MERPLLLAPLPGLMGQSGNGTSAFQWSLTINSVLAPRPGGGRFLSLLLHPHQLSLGGLYLLPGPEHLVDLEQEGGDAQEPAGRELEQEATDE